jgi:hypothetical protein
MSFQGLGTMKPPRVSFTDLRTAESFDMPFTPEGFSEKVSPQWNRQAILGMSHQNLQFGYTDNYQISGMVFPFLLPDPPGPGGLTMLDDGRRFLMSLCYPSETADSVRTGGPPRVLILWPNLLSLTCVLDGLTITHQAFNSEGNTVRFTASVDLVEIRDVRLTSETVRARGTRRSAGLGPDDI